jgi:hypothetical protein
MTQLNGADKGTDRLEIKAYTLKAYNKSIKEI